MVSSISKHKGEPGAQQLVGQRIRAIRLAKGISGRSLAERCGVSPSFISQVEGGQASPSIGSLERLARALGVGISDLFEPGPIVSPYVTRVGQRKRLASTWSRAMIEAVVEPGEATQLECILVTLSSGGMSARTPQIAAAEHVVFATDGVVELDIDGDTYRLAAGDAALVPQGARFRLSNEGAGPVQVLLVAPRSGAGMGLFGARDTHRAEGESGA